MDIDSLWNFDDPAASEKRFRELPASAEVQTQIARAQGLQRRFEEAHRTLNAITTNSPRVEVRYLLERGRVYNSSGKPDQARPLFLAAWEKAQQAKLDFFAVDAAHMIAIVEPPDSALAWNQRATAFAEQSADPKAKNWLGALYNNTGWTHYGKRDYARALEAFERSQASYAAQKRMNEVRIARYSIAKTYRAMGRVPEALAMQQEIQRQQPEDGYVHEEIAECLLALKRPAEAKPHFARAYKFLSQDPWLTANEPQRLERLKRLVQEEPAHDRE